MKYITAIIFLPLLFVACNKEKSFMKTITANWKIENSITILIDSLGQESEISSVSNAGNMMIYDEDPENPSKDSRLFDLIVYDNDGDTIISKTGGKLISDEKNKRVIMTKALSDSTHFSDIVWTIDINRKRKQVWSCFGVDSVLFYPDNNHNPGNASNWIEWKLELKKD